MRTYPSTKEEEKTLQFACCSLAKKEKKKKIRILKWPGEEGEAHTHNHGLTLHDAKRKKKKTSAATRSGGEEEVMSPLLIIVVGGMPKCHPHLNPVGRKKEQNSQKWR